MVGVDKVGCSDLYTFKSLGWQTRVGPDICERGQEGDRKANRSGYNHECQLGEDNPASILQTKRGRLVIDLRAQLLVATTQNANI